MKKFSKVMMLAVFFLMGMAGLDKGSAFKFDHRIAFEQCIHHACFEFQHGPHLQEAYQLCKRYQCEAACKGAGGTIKKDSDGAFCAGPGQ